MPYAYPAVSGNNLISKKQKEFAFTGARSFCLHISINKLTIRYKNICEKSTASVISPACRSLRYTGKNTFYFSDVLTPVSHGSYLC